MHDAAPFAVFVDAPASGTGQLPRTVDSAESAPALSRCRSTVAVATRCSKPARRPRMRVPAQGANLQSPAHPSLRSSRPAPEREAAAIRRCSPGPYDHSGSSRSAHRGRGNRARAARRADKQGIRRWRRAESLRA